MPPMGLSFQELNTLDKSPSKLYPEPPTVPRMERPDDKEIRYASYQLMYLQEQKTSAYWPVLEQRKQGDLTRFSDRYRPESQDLPSLKSINLQKEVFPKGLWDSFMEGETKKEELKAKKKARRKINWDSIDLEDRVGVSLVLSNCSRLCCDTSITEHLSTDPVTFLDCFLSSLYDRPKTMSAMSRPRAKTRATTRTKSTMTTQRTTSTMARMMTSATMMAASLPMIDQRELQSSAYASPRSPLCTPLAPFQSLPIAFVFVPCHIIQHLCRSVSLLLGLDKHAETSSGSFGVRQRRWAKRFVVLGPPT